MRMKNRCMAWLLHERCGCSKCKPPIAKHPSAYTRDHRDAYVYMLWQRMRLGLADWQWEKFNTIIVRRFGLPTSN